VDLVLGQLHLVEAQQLGRLGLGEREVGVADLAQPPGEVQPLQADRRIGPTGQHDVQRLGRVVDQVLQRHERHRRPGLVDVVQHQEPDAVAGCRRGRVGPTDLVEGRVELVLHLRCPGEPSPGPTGGRQQRRPEPGTEPARLVVPLVQAEPRGPVVAGLLGGAPEGARQQRGLARAGRTADQRDRMALGPVQPALEPRPAHRQCRQLRPPLRANGWAPVRHGGEDLQSRHSS
jgi:hypothetical protein